MEEGGGLDQVKEDARVATVGGGGEVHPFRVWDGDMEALLFEDPPDRPADREVGIFRIIVALSCLPILHVLKHPCILFERIVDPDRQHPVRHLVIPGILDLCQPPDTSLGDAADLELPVGGDGLVLYAHAEVRSRSLENLLEVIGERDIIEEEDRAGLEAVVVVESLVRDGAGEAVLLRNLLEHGGTGMGLPLPGVPRYRDMEAVCVLDRL